MIESNFNKEIFESISYNLQESKYQIFIAMAYFNDIALLDILIAKANEGIHIEIILNHNNEAENLTWNETVNLKLIELEKNGAFIWLNKADSKIGIMHHKFCVVDFFKVITGSYNWTNNAAKNNDENIIIFDDKDFEKNLTSGFNQTSKKFINEFLRLRAESVPFLQGEECVITLMSNKSLVQEGEEVTISWNSNKNGNLYLNGETIDTLNGSKRCNIYSTTYLNLLFKSEDFAKNKSIVIKVLSTPQITFDIIPNEIILGESAQLVWKVINAEKTIISTIGQVESEGQLEINPLLNTSYTIIAEGIKEDISISKAVKVYEFPMPLIEQINYPSHHNIVINSSYEIINKKEISLDFQSFSQLEMDRKFVINQIESLKILNPSSSLERQKKLIPSKLLKTFRNYLRKSLKK